MSRKAFTVAVVATTIAWSIGLSALLAPLSASAVSAGTLVKASLPAVYYVGSDMKRYVFPNEKTYKTWYADFGSVQTITDAELAALSIGGNVTYKPGIKMVKITTDPKVYAVDAHGTLRWVSSEAVAVCLYGASWNQMIDDVPDAFFTNYTIGADITSCGQYVPATVAAAASSINADKNLGGGVAGGALSVMLSSSQPMGGTLPQSANGVTVLKADVRNGSSSAVTLDSVTVKRVGPGSKDDFANVYVYEGNNRLTSERGLSTTNDVTFGGLNVALAAGETKGLSVVVDVAEDAGAGNVSSFQITAATAGAVSASGLPVSGPSFTMAGVHVGEVAIEKGGALSNPKAGQLGAKVATFKLTAGGDPGEDVMVNKIVLYYTGDLDRAKMSNLVLKQAGTTLATASALNTKDQAVFVLATPFSLEKGNTRTFDVYADIAGSAKADDEIGFYLETAADLLAIGQTYGYGVMVHDDGYMGDGGCAANDDECSWSMVQAGKLTITFNGPAAKDVGANSKDVELFNFTMAAASNLEVKETTFDLWDDGDSTIDPADITDIKLVDTASGVIVAGPMDGDENDGGLLTFDVSFFLTAGQSRTFKVTADIGREAGAEEEIQLVLETFAGHVKNLDNNTNLDAADMVPATPLVGNTHTVKLPTLDISVASTPVAQNYIMGAAGAPMVGFGFQAGAAGSVKLNSLTIDGAADEGNVSDLVQTASLWDGSTQVGSTESPNTTDGSLVFDNLNLTIAASATKTLTLKGNIPTGIGHLLTDEVQFSLSENGVDASDVDGDTVEADANNDGHDGDVIDGPWQHIRAMGSLGVVRAPSDVESENGLVIGGASNAVLGKFKWTAQYEELKITKLDVMVEDAEAVTSLSLYDGSTLVGGPVSVNGGTGVANFTGVNFVVPKDGSKTLIVKGNLAAVGSSGADSGSHATVTLLDGTAPHDFEARGTAAGSSTVIDDDDVAVVGDGLPRAGYVKVLHKTKPTISLVALPNSTLTAGSPVVQRFTIAADAAGDVSFQDISTHLIGSFVDDGVVLGDSYSLRPVGGSDVALEGNLDCTGYDCELELSLDDEETVSAGSSRTYEIRVSIAGTLTSGDSLSAELLGAPAGDDVWYQDFMWSDISALPHTMGSADWFDGEYVKTLPSDQQTLTK